MANKEQRRWATKQTKNMIKAVKKLLSRLDKDAYYANLRAKF